MNSKEIIWGVQLEVKASRFLFCDKVREKKEGRGLCRKQWEGDEAKRCGKRAACFSWSRPTPRSVPWVQERLTWPAKGYDRWPCGGFFLSDSAYFTPVRRCGFPSDTSLSKKETKRNFSSTFVKISRLISASGIPKRRVQGVQIRSKLKNENKKNVFYCRN